MRYCLSLERERKKKSQLNGAKMEIATLYLKKCKFISTNHYLTFEMIKRHVFVKKDKSNKVYPFVLLIVQSVTRSAHFLSVDDDERDSFKGGERNTVWKFKKFSAPQILREITFVDSKLPFW